MDAHLSVFLCHFLCLLMQVPGVFAFHIDEQEFGSCGKDVGKCDRNMPFIQIASISKFGVNSIKFMYHGDRMPGTGVNIA